jgi:hypothetical protein
MESAGFTKGFDPSIWKIGATYTMANKKNEILYQLYKAKLLNLLHLNLHEPRSIFVCHMDGTGNAGVKTMNST